MPITINGSGTISGASNFATAINLTSGQIAFPATQIPSSDPNTLDDYEEGTFTAYFAGNTSGLSLFSGTYPYGLGQTGANGRYTKIGKRVFYNFYINMASSFTYANGFGSSTGLWIGGLPFAESTIGTAVGTYPAAYCGYNVAASWSAAYSALGIIESGLSVIRIGYHTTNTFVQATASQMLVAGAAQIWAGHYEAIN